MLKQFLYLFGNDVDNWYEQMDKTGLNSLQSLNFYMKDELYMMQIRVDTQDGWKYKGMIWGGGPFVSEDKVYIIDLSDVPGETVRIKLTPPFNFWMINYVALDYSEDFPVQTTELAAIRAYDDHGRDISSLLAQNDGIFHVMPETGDSARMVFLAIPEKQGMARSYILKAAGYYDIHLPEKRGEAQWDTIERYRSEPGFAVKYAMEKWKEWKEEISSININKE